MTKKDAVKYVESLGYEYDYISVPDDLWYRDDTNFIRIRNVRRSVRLKRAFFRAGVKLDDGSWIVEKGPRFYYHLSELV